jgi:hypothetical protein
MHDPLPTRRGATVCVLLSVALAGCAGVPFLGASCGPGETELGSIDGSAENVTVEGEVTDVRAGALVLDDETGTAEVLVIDENATSSVETGDCLLVDGTASQTDESEQDVVMVAANLSTA